MMFIKLALISLLSAKAHLWKDPYAPIRITQYAKETAPEMGYHPDEFAQFLVALAWHESRGNSKAVGDGGNALGWFQLHDESRCLDKRDRHHFLRNERFQVKVAACHIYMLGTRWTSHKKIYWLAIRRGWKFPYLVRDHYEESSWSYSIRMRFLRSLRVVNASRKLMYKTVFRRKTKRKLEIPI